jgi:hypothetical protein
MAIEFRLVLSVGCSANYLSLDQEGLKKSRFCSSLVLEAGGYTAWKDGNIPTKCSKLPDSVRAHSDMPTDRAVSFDAFDGIEGLKNLRIQCQSY